jgi:hypothetical protein
MRSRLLLGSALVVFAAGCSAPASPPPPPAPAAAAPAPAGPVTPPTTDEGKIASAMSAGPEAVTRDATIVDMDAKMNMRTLRQGTNGWTCLPDMPTSPGADPMCLDKNGMEWAAAWMSHKEPPKNKMAIGYMLAGGSDASNEDPFAEKPHEGSAWVETGPHLMVLNIGDHFAGYPTSSENTKVPYVMYGKTPYAHLMVPVK